MQAQGVQFEVVQRRYGGAIYSGKKKREAATVDRRNEGGGGGGKVPPGQPIVALGKKRGGYGNLAEGVR